MASRAATAAQSRKIPAKTWRTFCEHFYLFRATPSGLWLRHELQTVFGLEESPDAHNADRLYNAIAEKSAAPEFAPRRLFERFNVEVLSTTDPAQDDLRHHRAIRDSGWHARIIPCFRPDGVTNLTAPGWRENITALGIAAGRENGSYRDFIEALEVRRAFFKQMCVAAGDHAALTPFTIELPKNEAEAIFQRGLCSEATRKDA